jgi:hypothetical protein
VLRILGYVMGHLRSKLVLDSAYRDWTHLDWHSADWKEFYPDAADDSVWNSGSLKDNASDTKNVTLPESTLHKRHHSIANHKCCEELWEELRVLRMNSGRFARSVPH